MHCGPLTLKFSVRPEYRRDPVKGLFSYALDKCAVCVTEFDFRLDY